MSGALKLKAIGTLFFCPEIVQGTANYDNTATGIGTATTAIVSTLNDALDDTFIGLQMFFHSGANAGRVCTVTDFVQGTTTLTFTPADGGAALSPVQIGEEFQLGAILPASNVSASPTTRLIERDDWETDTFDKPSGIAGPSETTLSADIEIGGLETPAGDGVTAGVDRFSRLLEMIGSFTSAIGTTVNGLWGTTTSGDVTSAAGLNVGDPIMNNSEIAIITAISTNTLTVAPAFTTAPADTSVINASETHTPADSGHKSFTFCQLRDDQWLEMRGVVANVKAAATFNELLKFSVDGQGGGWTITDSFTDIDGLQSTNQPVAVLTARIHFGAVGTYCNSFDFDLGHSFETLEDCYAGIQKLITDRSAVCSVTFRNVDKVALSTWEKSKTTGLVVIQAGNTAGNCVVIHGQAQIESVEDAEYGGTRGYKANLKFYDDRGALIPTKPKLSRL